MLRPVPTWVDRGDRTVWIVRHDGRPLPLPTLWITPPEAPALSHLGPAGLRWAGGRASDTVSWLHAMLAEHRTSASATAPGARVPGLLTSQPF